jgi:two-component system cell cycle sensor histidine kinase/response regulator CckA
MRVSDLLRRLIGEHIALDVLPAPDLALVLADAGQIEQVVMNLAVNARDAMEQGGRLAIETANVRLDSTSAPSDQIVVPGWYVRLSVVDTGSGMDAHTKRHLFEPFFTTKEQGKGTGLGLATVYGIVKQSGGYIWADSEPGKGSAFSVYLPRAERPVECPASAPEPAPSTRGSETVLLVEDEAGVRRLARRMLESAGYRVLDAANGPEAEAVFAQHQGSIDLLVSDVIMPGMSGPDLFRRLTRLQPALRVAYMSGYASETMGGQHGLQPGQPHLQKPFTGPQLTSCVRAALDAPPRPPGDAE